VPTACTPTLKGVFSRDGRPIPLIWPSELGTVKGESLFPLYSTVPRAVQHDPALHRLLALIDVVRVGDAKDRKLATDLLERMILETGAGRKSESQQMQKGIPEGQRPLPKGRA